MKRYLLFSSSGHLVLLTAWVIFSTLLSKPRMSYYAVDLFSAMPAGSPAGGGAAVVETPKAPPAPPAVEERHLPASEVIRVKGKTTKKASPPPPVKKKQGVNLKAALAAIGEGSSDKKNSGRMGMPGAGGSGLSFNAGLSFPYPWYTKLIHDRLDSQWHPPQEFQTDTSCVVDFVISREGRLSDAKVGKASGDTTFDHLALQAVRSVDSLPPLPAGFPDDTLNVHMTFQGKP